MRYRLLNVVLPIVALILALFATSFFVQPVFATTFSTDEGPPSLPRRCGLSATPIGLEPNDACCVRGYFTLGDTVLGDVEITILARGKSHTFRTEIGADNPYPSFYAHLSSLEPQVHVGDEVTITAAWNGYETSQTFRAVGGGQVIDLDLSGRAEVGDGALTFRDQVGGISHALTKVDNRVYMGEGPRLTIIDVADVDVADVDGGGAGAPQVLGKSDPLPGIVRDVAVRKTLTRTVAYVAAAEAGLRTFDVTDPADPQALSVYELNASAFGVTIDGDRVFVGNGRGGMKIYTTTVAGDLNLVGQLDTPGFTRKVTLMDEIAYVADEGGGLRIVDVGDISAPIELGSVATQSARRVVVDDTAVDGVLAYVADVRGGLRVIDVSDPSAPAEIGFWREDGSGVESVAVNDIFIYVADSYGGFKMLVANGTANPQLLDSIPQHSRDVIIEDGLIYVSGVGGLHIYDAASVFGISPPLGAYETIGFATDLAVVGSDVLVADWPNGLWSVDAGDSSSLRLQDLYRPEFAASRGVDVQGDRALLATKGLYEIDISNPADLTLRSKDEANLAFLDHLDVVTSGDYAYTITRANELRVTHLGAAERTLAATIMLPSAPRDLHIASAAGIETLYVATEADGVQVFGLADLAQPRLTGSLFGGSEARGVDTHGEWIAIADADGLRVQQRDSLSAVQRSVAITQTALAVDLTAEYAYVAAGGVQVIDVSDPLSLTLRASYPIAGGWSQDADIVVVDDGVQDGRVYVAADEAGLYVFDHEAAAAPVPEPSEPEPSESPAAVAWSILVYAAADNDLDTWLGHHQSDAMLTRLLGAGAADDVTVSVLYDGDDQGDSVRYQLEANGSWRATDLGEVAMDDPETLREFVEWGFATVPAEQTYLIIADHANGVLGIGLDETSDPSGDAYLTTAELRTALVQATENAGRTLDILHFDGCSFGLLENTSIAEGVADYVIASPNTGWGTFEYEMYRAFAGTAVSARDLAQQVAQRYSDEVARYDRPLTIAVHDMAEYRSVVVAVDSLGRALATYSDLGQDDLSAIRRSVQTYDSGNYRVDEQDRYVDLAALADALQTLNDTEVSTAAASVRDALGAFTIISHHQSGQLPRAQNDLYVNLDGANGLGIYYPPGAGGAVFSNYMQHRLFPELTSGWGWVEFLASGLPDLPFPVDGQEDERAEQDSLLAPAREARAWQTYLPVAAQ